MYMSPEVAERKPYGGPSDTYGLGCVLLEMLLRRQLRERRPFETRADYIREAFAAAHCLGWDTFERMGELVWRMLDEHPKTRMPLPTAAAVTSTAIANFLKQESLACTMPRNQSVHYQSNRPLLCPTGMCILPGDPGPGRLHKPKRALVKERPRAQAQERRRRLLYAD